MQVTDEVHKSVSVNLPTMYASLGQMTYRWSTTTQSASDIPENNVIVSQLTGKCFCRSTYRWSSPLYRSAYQRITSLSANLPMKYVSVVKKGQGDQQLSGIKPGIKLVQQDLATWKIDLGVLRLGVLCIAPSKANKALPCPLFSV